VRELGRHGLHFLLVKPGSVDQLAQAVLQLKAEPGLRSMLAANGPPHIAAGYTWERSGASLTGVCEELGIGRPNSD